MDADKYFEFGARCLIKQIDILNETLVYDKATDTYSFPASQMDVLLYEQRDFANTLEGHLLAMNAYREVYDSLYGGYDDETK